MTSHDVQPIKCRVSTVQLREDGILRVDIVEDESFDRADMEELIEAAGKIGKGAKLRNLIVVGKNTMPTPEAQDLSSSEEGSRYKIADAFVINSIGQKLIANFLTKVTSHTVPTRYFNNEEDAVAWLQRKS